MSSIDHLKGVFGPYIDWPYKELTLRQNLIDLARFEKESQMRVSFCYTVLDKEENKCLGCMYILPSPKPQFEIILFSWVRKSEYDKGLDKELYKFIKKWIKEKWPFKSSAWPGREISWKDWEKY